MSDDFDDLLTTDAEWCRTFKTALKILEDWSTGQLALLPVDDLMGQKRYVPCPLRGTHRKITSCWMCWCDWACGQAELNELIPPEETAA